MAWMGWLHSLRVTRPPPPIQPSALEHHPTQKIARAPSYPIYKFNATRRSVVHVCVNASENCSPRERERGSFSKRPPASARPPRAIDGISHSEQRSPSAASLHPHLRPPASLHCIVHVLLPSLNIEPWQPSNASRDGHHTHTKAMGRGFALSAKLHNEHHTNGPDNSQP